MIEQYRKQIEAALEYAGGTHAFDDIADGVASGRFQLWPGPHSVMITEILESPRKKAVNVFLAAGNLAELERMEPLVCEFARRRGCTSICMTGRRGWLRTFLPKHAGWKDTRLVVLEKRIGE
jgi:hypothetical protein